LLNTCRGSGEFAKLTTRTEANGSLDIHKSLRWRAWPILPKAVLPSYLDTTPDDAVGADMTDFLRGTGTMVGLFRNHDWPASGLDQPPSWPAELRTLVGVMLAAKQPMFTMWGPERTLLYNDGYIAMLADRHPSALGRPFFDVWPDARDDVAPLVEQVFAGQAVHMADLELRLDRPGRPLEAHFAFSYTPVRGVDGGVDGLFCTCTETTDQVFAHRRSAEEAIKRETMFQQMPGFVALLSGPEHVYEYVNDAYVKISGPRAFVGRTVREVFPELVDQGIPELLDQVYATGKPFIAPELPLVLAGEQRPRYIDLLYQPLCENDVVTGIFVGGYDITERVTAEQRRTALLELDDRLRELHRPEELAQAAARLLGKTLGVSRVGYGIVDAAANTIAVQGDWSATGAPTLAGEHRFADYGTYIEDLQRGRAVIVGDVATAPQTAGRAEAFSKLGARAFIDMPVVEAGRTVAQIFVHSAEPREWAEVEVTFIHDFAERTRTAIARREAERALVALNETLETRVAERTEALAVAHEQLRQSQKMEAVGQLTGGLAHDFNNLLAGISGALELIRMRMAQGRLADVDKYVTAAQGASKRAAALTHRLLAFSRRQTLSPKPTDVKQLVAGMRDLISRTVGPQIALETIDSVGLWPSLIDPSQLENAVLNLCINARDAMPDGGTITIETANRWLDRRMAQERGLEPGQYISLCVSDTGTGMPPDVVEKAFDPFFTTKPIGLGTGLGLSMIYGFAKQSGGSVHIYSEVGQGTNVCIYLPRHNGEAEVEDGTAALSEAPRGDGETVLVVDDEATVRMLVTEVLDDLGYHAIEAEDGPSALKVLNSNARIDLLVTDVGLPGGMNGRQVADAARVARPGLNVLFITGYAENAVLSHGHLDPGMHVMTKPFAMEALASRLREFIDG